jgi:arylsulfatase A-like enzyme/Tfp pilus assembly protein PilF
MKKKKKLKLNSANTPAEVKKHTFLRRGPFLILFALLILGGTLVFILKSRNSDVRNLAGKFKNFNVMLITIDTLRADHLPSYGYTHVKTPHLDELAGKSLLFKEAFAHVPLTLPSHTSILTGLLPIRHGVRDNGGYILDQKVTTLAEILQNKGYSTSAFVSAFVLDSQFHLDQGFQFYFDDFNIAKFQDALFPRDIQRPGAVTEAEFEKWLDSNKDHRFFSWVHFYDPHDPYQPPEPYKSQYATNPYDGEIAYTDEILGRLLAKLKALNLDDRTIIVLTGDHGESLGEHGEQTHGMFIYEATMHVPLIIHLPNVNPESIEAVVRHIDVAPSLLEWLGFQPDLVMQGSILDPVIEGKETKRRDVYAESLYAEDHYGWSGLKSITKDNYKFIEAPKPELYNRKEDPNETRNLITQQSSIAKTMEKELKEFIQSQSSKDLKGRERMDPETEEKLRALGYIGTTSVSKGAGSNIDPKDKIHLHRALAEVYAAFLQKNNQRVVELVVPILREDPNMIEAHFIAGVTYAGMGRYQDAIPELLTTIKLQPANAMAEYNLGFAYQMLGKYKDAESWYLSALKSDETNMFAVRKLAELYVLMKEPDRAKAYYLRAVNHYEDSVKSTKDLKTKGELYSILAEIHFRAGNLSAAEENLKAAIALAPDGPILHFNLAQIYEARGNFEGAIQEYQKEVEVNPSNSAAFQNLGLLKLRSNQPQQAMTCFQTVVKLDPTNSQAYILLATAYQKMGREDEAQRILQQVRMIKQEPNN